MKIALYTVISELNVQLGSILKALAFPNEKLITAIKMKIENSIKSNSFDKLAAVTERENKCLVLSSPNLNSSANNDTNYPISIDKFQKYT